MSQNQQGIASISQSTWDQFIYVNIDNLQSRYLVFQLYIHKQTPGCTQQDESDDKMPELQCMHSLTYAPVCPYFTEFL